MRPFGDRISEIVEAEWQCCYDKKFARFMKNAALRYPAADFDETIYNPARMLDTTSIEALATRKWVDQGKNLLVTGPTSSEKSYLMNAICIAAIRQFKTVRYINSFEALKRRCLIVPGHERKSKGPIPLFKRSKDKEVETD